MSSNSGQRVVDGARHPDLVLNQTAAGTTTRAILDVVTWVRNHEPVT